MTFLLYIYILVAFGTGIVALVKGEIAIGAVGIIGANLCWFAGAGIRGSLMVGNRSQTVGGLVSGLLFIFAALGLAYYFGFKLRIFGYVIPGILWFLVGAIIGWLSATRKDAETPVFATPRSIVEDDQ